VEEVTVYVVTYDQGDGELFNDVFLTRDKAEEWVKLISLPNDYDSYRVTEWEAT
jgi:hypothetical protein